MKPYQWIIINELWTCKDPMGSGELHKTLNKDYEVHISRASVIFFLQELADHELATKTLKTGKGGHAGRYAMNITEPDLSKWIISETMKKVQAVFTV